MDFERNQILFSVIVPTYNSASTICDSLESVLNQGFVNVEIIVVDDGSTDNTRQIIESRFPLSRVHYYRQEHNGPFAGRRFGISKAQGDYVCFLDADDTLMESCFLTLFSFFQRYPSVDYIHFGFDVLANGILNEYGNDSKEKTVDGHTQIVETLFFGRGQNEICRYCFKKKAISLNSHWLTTQSRKSEDLLMVYNILRSCHSGLYINTSLYLYKLSPKTESAEDLLGVVHIYEKILRDLLARNESSRSLELVTNTYKNYIIALFDRMYLEFYPYAEMKREYAGIKNADVFCTLRQFKLPSSERWRIKQIYRPLFLVYALFYFWRRRKNARHCS